MNSLPVVTTRLLGNEAKMNWQEFWFKRQNLVIGSLTLIAFFLIWEAIFTWFMPLNKFIMSKPSLIFDGWAKDLVQGRVLNDVLISGKPFLFGFVSAGVVGVFIGTMMGWRLRVGYSLDPLMTAFYASPLVAVAPLMIIAFGVGVSGKAILIFLLCVFPFIFNTYAGVKAVDQLLVNVVRSLGGSQSHIYLKVIVPSVLPYIVAGTRYAIGRALVGILVGEFYAATAGIGFRIAWYSDMYVLDRMFGYIFTMMVIAVALTEGIRWAERTAFPWRIGM
ncbi:MAG: ABC transporter permease [Pseudomonadota bacterium]|nr:ABC transporter permease [Pseudomonadota bacterium]